MPLNLQKNNIKFFAISFVNSHKDVEEVKKIVGHKAFIISKIETKNSLKNLSKISKVSDALLIDRGDLSRYVPIENKFLSLKSRLLHLIIKLKNQHMLLRIY